MGNAYCVNLDIHGKELPKGCAEVFERMSAGQEPSAEDVACFPAVLQNFSAKDWLWSLSQSGSRFHFSRSYVGNPHVGDLKPTDKFNFTFAGTLHDDDYAITQYCIVWLMQFADDGFAGTVFQAYGPKGTNPELIYVFSGHRVTVEFPSIIDVSKAEADLLSGLDPAPSARKILDFSVPKYRALSWSEIERSFDP